MAEGVALKLNLCCGNKHLEGFVNIDFPDSWHDKAPDIALDLSQPLPFDDASICELHCYHGFEHFYRFEADDILLDWARVLKQGGLMVLELPCLDKIIGIFNAAIRCGNPPPDHLTMGGLYGDLSQRSKAMSHRWCYSVGELSEMMEGLGLMVERKPPQTHQPVRDMRLEGRKQNSA